ncbi:MarR family winged helix-turn-helix transcriptional regulator [Nakamurella endophytica]|uniref:MarR family transcriptional regulator n=1 Tax=Nakamurella endophytica TaxID=1748367 RepID=A0A917SPF1_9ACTN|nr:MarR family transcriptional regulator [Nakamurella endophytica]GGL89979.1 MarR family transcriptional regulator [Nakamurella endophytica]
MLDAARPLALPEMVCFDLAATSRTLTALYRELLDDLGLTYPQYLVLVVLWREGRCTIGELRDRLRLDYGTMTPLLRRLENAGLLTRTRRTDDERSVLVELTVAGRELEPRAAGVAREVGHALGLTATEAAALQQTLRTVADSVHRRTAELAARRTESAARGDRATRQR